MEKGYKKLIVWQRADAMVLEIYKQTKSFPKDETFGLISQLRRAAVSVVANIVEGSGRQNKNELKHFFNIALGSLAETEYLLELCAKLNYLNEHGFEITESKRKEVGALLWLAYKNI